MSHEFDEKRDLAQYFILSYNASRQGLKKLGILRSERNVQGDYAEWLAAEILDLRLAANTVEKGFDATDREGRTYQIKARLVQSLDETTSFDFKSMPASFDYLVCVFLSHTLELLGIACVPYQVVRELGKQNENSFRFRWNKRTASDPRIKKVV